jgi:hypothetical protein
VPRRWRGCGWTTGIALAAMPVLLLMVIAWCSRSSPDGAGAVSIEERFILTSLAVALPSLCFLHGLRKLTTPEPTPQGLRRPYRLLRPIVRLVALVGVAGAVLLTIAASGVAPAARWMFPAGLGLAAAWIPAVVGMGLVLRGLGRRLEHPAMVRATWVIVVAMVLTLMVGLASGAVVGHQVQGPAVLCALTSAVFIYSVFGCALLMMYASSLRSAQRRSRRLARG